MQATTLTFSTINASHAREALVNTKVLWTGVNHERSLLCKTEESEPVQTCFWVRSPIESPDDPSLNITVPHPEGEDNPKYAPYGKGLMAGECGVTIKSVGKADFGFWNCTLITEKFGVFVGTTQVLQWGKLTKIVHKYLKSACSADPSNNFRKTPHWARDKRKACVFGPSACW